MIEVKSTTRKVANMSSRAERDFGNGIPIGEISDGAMTQGKVGDEDVIVHQEAARAEIFEAAHLVAQFGERAAARDDEAVHWALQYAIRASITVVRDSPDRP